MNWTAVESTQIAEVGYEAATRTMGIRFKAKGKWAGIGVSLFQRPGSHPPRHARR